MYSLCMPHQVTWGASPAAQDSTIVRDAAISRCLSLRQLTSSAPGPSPTADLPVRIRSSVEVIAHLPLVLSCPALCQNDSLREELGGLCGDVDPDGLPLGHQAFGAPPEAVRTMPVCCDASHEAV
jgi:hypothetical protein